MKLNRINKVIRYSGTAIGLISLLAGSVGYANPAPAPGSVYVGIFGGVATPNDFDINQYGTAFYTEAAGGPLAVNAFGESNSPTEGFIGAQLGYQWTEILFSSRNPEWSFAPAVEMEGFYIGKTTFDANDVNNNTVRLDEHNFAVTYPTRTGVFLTNGVFSINSCHLGGFHPYIGLGIGGAVVSITGATATQISPPEVGVNHFNTNTSDRSATFAAQAKLGLNYDVSKSVSMFVEYRRLYISSTSFAFGSTVSPGHVETSNWQVKMDPRYYNLGAIGIQYSV